jgi:site-specific DNA-methyltransferase (adenine-specific)
MKFMADKPDNHYDLAIVDPPYGIGADIGIGGDNKGKVKKYKSRWDDNIPNDKYFKELKRVSKNQIIWGVNYYNNLQGGRVVWDKDNTGNFSDCEIAFQSFSDGIRKFVFRWNGMIQADMKNKESRIHPTQKPVALYKWLLQNYAKKGDKILDTHGGSMSIAIACHDMGFGLDLCELDKDYFEAGKKRYEKHISQIRMF